MTILELRPSWIAPGKPDKWGDDARLLARKQARLNGGTLVRAHERRAR